MRWSTRSRSLYRSRLPMVRLVELEADAKNLDDAPLLEKLRLPTTPTLLLVITFNGDLVWTLNDVGVNAETLLDGFSRPSGGGLGEFRMLDRSKSAAISNLACWICGDGAETELAFRVAKGSFGVRVDNVFIVSSTFLAAAETSRRGSRDVVELFCRKLRVPTLETSAVALLDAFFSIFRRVISETIGLPMVTRLTDVRTRTEELRSTETETVTGPVRFSSQVLQASLSSSASASSLTEIKNLTTLLIDVAKSCEGVHHESISA